MARLKKDHPSDTDVSAILNVLKSSYGMSHPHARIDSYRQNSASLRIRIIDPDFRGKDRAERFDQVWDLLEGLPEAIQSQITVLLLLTPDETKTSPANVDFEHPIPSRL